MTINNNLLIALDKTVKEIKNLSKEELDKKLEISKETNFAKTIDNLISFTKNDIDLK